MSSGRVTPFALNHVAERIVAVEKCIGDHDLPGVSYDLLPALHGLGTGDDHLFAGSRLIDDAPGIGRSAARRIDALAVDAGMDGDGIARLGKVGGMLDAAERRGRCPGTGVTAGDGDVATRWLMQPPQ